MIPIMRPSLPKAEDIAKVIKVIDDNHWFSNNGPINRVYETQLAKLFGNSVVTASSATSVLTAALIALRLPKGSLVACPSWTFVATPAAIIAAGHIPYFLDVSEEDWSIAPGGYDGSIEAVVYVSPFGRPLHITQKHDVPVIIDAAAGFDAFSHLKISDNHTRIFSTHCTKTFCTGEGGFVVSEDESLLMNIRAVLNHGIAPDRNVYLPGINGKLSEYHAAIGFIEMEEWQDKRKEWKRVQEWYGDNSPFVTSTHLVTVPDAYEAKEILAQKGIETRVAWYGCHQHPAFKDYPRTDMTVTERLMRTQLAVPKFIGMQREEVEFVLESLKSCACQ